MVDSLHRVDNDRPGLRAAWEDEPETGIASPLHAAAPNEARRRSEECVDSKRLRGAGPEEAVRGAVGRPERRSRRAAGHPGRVVGDREVLERRGVRGCPRVSWESDLDIKAVADAEIRASTERSRRSGHGVPGHGEANLSDIEWGGLPTGRQKDSFRSIHARIADRVSSYSHVHIRACVAERSEGHVDAFVVVLEELIIGDRASTGSRAATVDPGNVGA